MAYLVSDGNDEVDVAPVLRRLDASTYRADIEELGKIVGACRHWLGGRKDDHLHHDWPDDPEFSMGYVFKWDHQRQHRRLYGFLATPRPRHEVCILCCFRAKQAFRTEAEAKRIVRAMSADAEVKEAVKRVFGRGGNESWHVH